MSNPNTAPNVNHGNLTPANDAALDFEYVVFCESTVSPIPIGAPATSRSTAPRRCPCARTQNPIPGTVKILVLSEGLIKKYENPRPRRLSARMTDTFRALTEWR